MSAVREILNNLWDGSAAISFFVHQGNYFWVIDDKENFSLNAEVDYRAYLEKKYITQFQFDEACRLFRGGILNLTAQNFSEYLKARPDKIYFKESLSSILFDGIDGKIKLLDEVEASLSSGERLSQNSHKMVQTIICRLPKFLINFDRKLYLHLDYGRMHEDSTDSSWDARYGDFVALVPDCERYWLSAGRDYWKCREI